MRHIDRTSIDRYIDRSDPSPANLPARPGQGPTSRACPVNERPLPSPLNPSSPGSTPTAGPAWIYLHLDGGFRRVGMLAGLYAWVWVWVWHVDVPCRTATYLLLPTVSSSPVPLFLNLDELLSDVCPRSSWFRGARMYICKTEMLQ